MEAATHPVSTMGEWLMDLSPLLILILTLAVLYQLGLVGSKRQGTPVKKAPKKTWPPLFLNVLPFEMRLQIYRVLLTKERPIKMAGSLAKYRTRKSVHMTYDDHRGLYPAIMRSCRQIYTETLPILYGANTFHFFRAANMSIFRKHGLFRINLKRDPSYRIPIFNLEPKQSGRLTMIKQLHISVPQDYSYTVPYVGDKYWRDEVRVPDWRTLLLQDWAIDSGAYATFPALEVLCLDNCGWEFNDDDELATDLFITKFRGSVGLRRVVVKGVTNKRTLRELEQGLLRSGGQFVVID